MAGTGHQSLQLMFILKAPNVHSRRLLATKEANDFHASFFFYLSPTAKASGPLLLLPSDWHQNPPRGAVLLGVSRRLREGPTVPPGHL